APRRRSRSRTERRCPPRSAGCSRTYPRDRRSGARPGMPYARTRARASGRSRHWSGCWRCRGPTAGEGLLDSAARVGSVSREPGAVRRGRLLRAWREGRTGPLALALTPAAWAYRAGLLAREGAYARGWLTRGRLPCPVVSVGNLTVGGTGKTPAVEMVARWLVDEGRRVAIVSRGYGRRPAAPVELVSDGGGPRVSAERAGEEPLLLS